MCNILLSLYCKISFLKTHNRKWNWLCIVEWMLFLLTIKVAISVSAVAVVTYIKVAIGGIMRGKGRSYLLWFGAVTQVGSCIGALSIFAPVNVYGYFKQEWEFFSVTYFIKFCSPSLERILELRSIWSMWGGRCYVFSYFISRFCTNIVFALI